MQRLFRVGLVAATVLTLIFALSPKPPELLHSDKSQHELAFASLALLSRLAFPTAQPLLIFGVLGAFGGLIEILQLIPALHRTSDLFDWIADLVAIAAALLVVALFRAGRKLQATN